VDVWSATSSNGFSLNRQIDAPAVLGVTQTVLGAWPAGIWDHGPALRVRLSAGQLSSVTEEDVLNGANAAVIGDGSTENWEVFQFTSAQLVGPRTYDLSVRLRGQSGTDGVMPASWPVGSYFVLLDGAIPQLQLSASARGLTRFYRVGQADRGYSDPKVVSAALAFNGIGLRPYSVAHLEATGAPGSTVMVQWIRRTRIEGDSWLGLDVPLGEESELYQIQVHQGATLLREEYVTLPEWAYTPALQLADGASAGFSVAVAQVSTRFGPGPFRQIVMS
jgi:hypothetical protein